ncbi:hypothetical protein VHUM_03625 [Vanrija humicola]|uniref:AB hydrolase-1 domain-containing protein n=1 Tax=Vanrija humicola TaxID=5417 RepID=A0A7D8UZN4_VANHU|nr:hypothetical protein VHUM_03625 [Vanrija humicola]
MTSYPPWTRKSAHPAPVIPSAGQHRGARFPLLPPSGGTPPAYPATEALPPPPEGYERSLHALPAAYPRALVESSGTLTRGSAPFGEPPANESKEERKARIKRARDNAVQVRADARAWDVDENGEVEPEALSTPPQWIAAERWRRTASTDDAEGVTLVFVHANGFQKEHFHPMAKALLERGADPTTAFGTTAPLANPVPVPPIDDIWFIDAVHHGDSVTLNAGLLGPAVAWEDTARDVANFVKHVAPLSDRQAPEHIPWRPSAQPRRVIGIGHSFGGNALVQASAAYPQLLDALFLVEPMTIPVLVNDPGKGWPFTLGALKRRDTWPSRAAAAEANRASPLFKSWSDDVYALWVSHSLVPVSADDPDGEVTLATPGWCEAACFSNGESPQRGWDALAAVRVPTAFVMAGDPVWMVGEDNANELVWRPELARNEVISDAGHMAVQEKPGELADALARFLATVEAGEWTRGDETAQARL